MYTGMCETMNVFLYLIIQPRQQLTCVLKAFMIQNTLLTILLMEIILLHLPEVTM